MKKRVILITGLVLIIFLGFVDSVQCNLDVSMINQDPYPAIPGETVKVVFQINGVSDINCGIVNFEVKESFPFTVDPESENPVIINSGTYVRKYGSFYLAPYKIRIDENALDGENPIEVEYSSSTTAKLLEAFNISIENLKADFEVYVKDYNTNTQTLTLEILNIVEVDVEALTIEIPKQDSIQVRGTNKIIVGDLDSNEYTTADFGAVMKSEGDIKLNIFYTDSANTRRAIEKTVHFDPSYFNGLRQKSQPIWLYVIIIAVLGFFGWRWYKKRKIKKRLHHQHQEAHHK